MQLLQIKERDFYRCPNQKAFVCVCVCVSLTVNDCMKREIFDWLYTKIIINENYYKNPKSKTTIKEGCQKTEN